MEEGRKMTIEAVLEMCIGELMDLPVPVRMDITRDGILRVAQNLRNILEAGRRQAGTETGDGNQADDPEAAAAIPDAAAEVFSPETVSAGMGR